MRLGRGCEFLGRKCEKARLTQDSECPCSVPLSQRRQYDREQRQARQLGRTMFLTPLFVTRGVYAQGSGILVPPQEAPAANDV